MRVRLVAARDVDRVLLFTTPAALNLDQDPGVDGIRAMVYTFQHSEARPVAIRDGSVEILMYEGHHSDSAQADQDTPFQVWSFPSEELAMRAAQSAVGVGYPLVLRWEGRRPEGEIRVVARVLDEEGDIVYSRPVSLSMGLPRG